MKWNDIKKTLVHLNFFEENKCHMSIIKWHLSWKFSKRNWKVIPLDGYLYTPSTSLSLFHHFFYKPLEIPLRFCNSHSRISNSFSKSFEESTMDYCPIVKRALSISYVADIICPILKDNLTYVPKPHMKEEKRKTWYSQVLIPYSIVSTTYAFMSPLPRHIR